MNNWVFGRRSNEKLQEMHPDLRRVFVRALSYSKYDFGITQALRTKQEQADNIKRGASFTMNSKHLKQPDGWSHAGDILVYKGGNQTWEPGAYRKVMQAFVTAAIEEGVQIRLGGLWESVFDGPHIEMV